MTNNDNTRDLIHEMANTLQYLGDDYTLTKVECDPGDSAIRIIKRNSEKTLYIIAYNNPNDTETRLYDEHDNLTAQYFYYDGAFDKLTTREVADLIGKPL